MPLARMLINAVSMGLADGSTEIHKATIARQAFKDVEPSKTGWPSEHLPLRRAAAREDFAEVIERYAANRPRPQPESMV